MGKHITKKTIVLITSQLKEAFSIKYGSCDHKIKINKTFKKKILFSLSKKKKISIYFDISTN